MNLRRTFAFVRKNPRVLREYLHLRSTLNNGKALGKFNFLFQCDTPAHFSYLAPYYEQFTGDDVDIYFSIYSTEYERCRQYLKQAGVPEERILRYIELANKFNWDLYMSPTSWGNIFPKNIECPRIQIFHSLADKNILYGESLRNFNVIFVNGPVHHDLLNKYLFSPYPESRKHCRTYDVGYAKVDKLLTGGAYDMASLRDSLHIPRGDSRRIIIYAPNWERTSALYRYGPAAFDALADTGHLVLIKLHYMSLLRDAGIKDTSRDWNSVLRQYSSRENVRVLRDDDITPYLGLADLMVTDYGGAAFEFMCTGKPIVYLDCPEFFELRGTDIMEYWTRDPRHVVKAVDGLRGAIAQGLSDDSREAQQRYQFVHRLLFNPGNAGSVGKRVILKDILGAVAR